MSGAEIVFGSAFLTSEEDVTKCLDLLAADGHKRIDTAAFYNDGLDEKRLHDVNASSRFSIDTKAKAGLAGPGGASKANVIADAKRSRELLGHDVDIFYLHAYDATTPLAETLEGVNEVYKTGFFKRFGLSNFPATVVQEIHELAKAKGYPLPSVYQANYSAVSRRPEFELFPTLRKLNIAVDAYSPIAGGLLAKSRTQIGETGEGRWDPSSFIGQMYNKMYNKPAYLEALDQWARIAQKEGVAPAELAYRWVVYSSALKRELGDSVIVGATKVPQLEQSLAAIRKGPLSKTAVDEIEAMWKTIEHEAPLDNIQG